MMLYGNTRVNHSLTGKNYTYFSHFVVFCCDLVFTNFVHITQDPLTGTEAIDLFHNIFSSSGEHPEHCKLVHEL